MKGNFTKGKHIGDGKFGSVYIATHKETGDLCALREVRLFSSDINYAKCKKLLEEDIQVLTQLEHQNIVKCYGHEIVGDTYSIYLEYISRGSMKDYMSEHGGDLTESLVRGFTRQITSGLAYLHAKNVVHRDIKVANVFVGIDDVVKLADFGMAKHVSPQADVDTLLQTTYWMAPEIIQAIHNDRAYAVDIWSLGCTVIEMLTGLPPWSEYDGVTAMSKILSESPTLPEKLSPDAKHFLQRCFCRDPAERATANDLLKHPFLAV